MIFTKFFTASLFTVGLFSAGALNAYEEAEAVRNLGIEIELIELDRADFAKLVFGKILGRDESELRGQIQKMIAEESASLRAHTIIRTRSGVRAKAESIDQYIYATEFDDTGAPRSFETQSLGFTAEVDPVLGKGVSVVELNLAPEFTILEGKTSEKWRDPESGKEVTAIHPRFHTQRLSAAVSCPVGAYLLIGTTTPSKSEDPKSEKISVWFLRTHVAF